jgi:prepilin-type processing-associated H-X9-DG protein
MIMKTKNKLVIEKNIAGGFTLVELAVVIATLAVLAALLLPALAGTKPTTQAFQCLENQHQLILAWQMYAQDNCDILPPNDYPFTTSVTRNGSVKNWVFGTEYATLDAISTAILVNPQLTLLAGYNTNPIVYHCPADVSFFPGTTVPRARSVSMNSAVGTIWYSASSSLPAGGPVGGGWLGPEPFFTGGMNSEERTYGKITQMTKPGPSMTWIIIDENPTTINDGSLAVNMASSRNSILVDFPANYHNGAAGVSFADGHTEMHRWVDAFAKNLSLTGATGGPGSTSYMAPIPCLDLAWLQPRTTALR